MFDLHDWTLLSVNYEWENSKCTLLLDGPDARKELIAQDVSDLRVPRHNDWGPSVSVNSVTDPVRQGDGTYLLTIKMQTGDEISITAAEFALVTI
jgi:hypothetical protein